MPSGEYHEPARGRKVDNTEFPIEKTNQEKTDLSTRVERRPVTKYIEAREVGSAPGPGSDSLLFYWHILFRHRMTLLKFTLVGLLAAVVISLVQTPIYRVRTSLEIQNTNLPDMKNSDSNGNYSSPESFVETQVKLLQSESLIEHTIDKMKLHQQAPATGWGAFAARVQGVLAWARLNRLPEKEQMIRQVERNLTVRTSGNSRLLEILYESPDSKTAAEFANTLVSQFIELTQEERWKAAQGTAEWLTNHLDQMKGQLEASEAQLQDYARTTGLSFTPDKESLAENKLKELQDQLSKAQSDRINSQTKFEAARSKTADTIPQVLDDPTMREERQKLAELKRQYAELSSTLTPAHYRVQRLQAQITEMEAQIQKERSNVQGSIRNEYLAALRREKLLSDAHAAQEKVVADQASKAIHYDTLKRDVESNRKLYETMLQRVKEASLVAAMRDSNVMVIDRARPPLLPYRPNLPMNSAIGIFGGAFLGFGFIVLRERLNRRISAPGEAQIYLDLPELGAIPLDAAALPMRAQHPRLNGASRVPLPDPLKATAMAGGPELATWKRKPSMIAECARTTLTSILLPNQDGKHPQVVVLTSPCMGDGKTTVACNLSSAMAEIGRKVLLIDGDLRRPRLHKVFGVSNSRGLSDLLWAESQLETAPLSHLVRETEMAGLSLLTGGSCGVTPTNLFYSSRMSALLARLRREFDMIMIDAPPMIHLADARVLGRLSDGVILVIRSGQTTTESARFAIQRFAEDGTLVLGTVLNNWDPKNSGHYGYGDYGTREYVAH